MLRVFRHDPVGRCPSSATCSANHQEFCAVVATACSQPITLSSRRFVVLFFCSCVSFNCSSVCVTHRFPHPLFSPKPSPGVTLCAIRLSPMPKPPCSTHRTSTLLHHTEVIRKCWALEGRWGAVSVWSSMLRADLIKTAQTGGRVRGCSHCKVPSVQQKIIAVRAPVWEIHALIIPPCGAVSVPARVLPQSFEFNFISQPPMAMGWKCCRRGHVQSGPRGVSAGTRCCNTLPRRSEYTSERGAPMSLKHKRGLVVSRIARLRLSGNLVSQALSGRAMSATARLLDAGALCPKIPKTAAPLSPGGGCCGAQLRNRLIRPNHMVCVIFASGFHGLAK
eukprot:TRINITY_DN1259_c0_g1_i3.p1 TRINITY_DN1259_c0_g1~~TRINITY_DN1259_c0_g1_i3.p1  ORF type:complete len:335 (+),score=-88.66 TRINITY_DN1259_c0_g1_i3:867-1871(+)